MTIEEINALDFENYRESMASRLWVKMNPIPEEMPEFTDPELEAEFTLFKNGLITIENERLRKKDLSDRFNAMKNIDESFHGVYPHIANKLIWLRQLLERNKNAGARSQRH
jgi:hypothetical protein